ncbi:MAG: 50S ribosomal protein L6, partial [Verrucomicrobiota bacterium]
MSRIGNQQIDLPEKVALKVESDSTLSVEGPKGKLEWALPVGLDIEQEEGVVRVTRNSEERRLRALHGTAR